jgi:hypothetical protein
LRKRLQNAAGIACSSIATLSYHCGGIVRADDYDRHRRMSERELQRRGP